MYGYNVKAKILKVTIESLMKKGGNIKDQSIEYLALRRMVKNKHADRYIAALTLDGFIEKKLIGKFIHIKITDRGISAQANEYFEELYSKWFWNLFRDVVMVIANLAVAIIAYFALTGDTKKNMQEIQSLQLRLTKMESLQNSVRQTKDTVLYIKMVQKDSIKSK